MGHLTDFVKNDPHQFVRMAEVEVPAEIDFGNPRYQDCRFLGICRINFHNRAASNLMPSCCPGRAQGYIRRWEETGVELVLPKEKMAPATLERHFGGGWFTITDAYELSADMAQRLGIAGFRFEPGKYPVRETADRLHVVFA
ncbi:MAG: hypothetical protein IT258_18650 [Saprospiraceae bacterium]|nr:hypothetical protein [Saprospiraceae bacterium]